MDTEADSPAEVLESEDVTVEDDFEAFEAEASEELEEDDEASNTQDVDTPDDQEPTEAEDDLEEVEINGKTYKVPKDSAFRQADYTRKTMALAERSKEVEATLERLSTVSQEETRALANVAIVNAELAQYQDVDWEAWEETNPQDAARHWRRFTQLKEANTAATNSYHEVRRQAQSVAQQETAKRLEQGHKVLAEKITGWGPDKARAIRDFAIKDYGFSPEEIDGLDNPKAILVLHDAMEGRKVRTQAATKAKIEKQQAVKPVTTLKGNSGRVAVSPATKDFAAFEKLANKSLR